MENEIFLSEVEYMGFATTEYDLAKMKSGRVYRMLLKNPEYNCIIIPVRLFNIIEHHPYFVGMNSSPVTNSVYKIGHLNKVECLVDLRLSEDQLVLTNTKEIKRQKRIDNLLNNVDFKEQKFVKIYY